MKVKIRDSVFAHQEFSTPYNNSKLLEWDRTSKISDEDLVIYTDTNLLEFRPNNPNNIAWLIEPKDYHSIYYDWLRINQHNFKEIWTNNPEIFGGVSDKVKIVPWGGCWIAPEDQQIYTKSKLCSIVASGKTQLLGHRLRHHVIKSYTGFDLYGHGYNPIDHKISALRDYKFSITIENTKSSHYFTEKIIDCFKTGSIPIYWGCDKIGDTFNPDGILQFDSFEKLEKILSDISDDKYELMHSAMVDNFERANKYLTVEDWLINNKYL